MKVKLTQEYKKNITVAEMPIVREIIADMKEDLFIADDYAPIAIRAAFDGKAYDIEILKASASIAKNQRAWNAYNDHSKSLDIWIKATAYVNSNEFVMIGAYLTDIWQIDGDNNKEIAEHMYIRRFKEAK